MNLDLRNDLSDLWHDDNVEHILEEVGRKGDSDTEREVRRSNWR